MRIAITGAAGFVGETLVRHLRRDATQVDLVLSDQRRPDYDIGGASCLLGDLTDRQLQAELVEASDAVIHLACLPGGAAEADHDASRCINLDLTLDLMRAVAKSQKSIRFVYASSIAVFGAPYPNEITDDTAPRPVMTYGAHKLMSEIALADLTRRGALDGIAIRLPGLVARPQLGAGLKSAFLSAVFHAEATEPLALPVSPNAHVWLMSGASAARNLAHAALLPQLPADLPRAITLPALRVNVADLIAAIAAHKQTTLAIQYDPDAMLEAQFGAMPMLKARTAEAAGFAGDGDLRALVANVYAALSGRTA